MSDTVGSDSVSVRPHRRHRRLPGARVLRDGSVLYWWFEIVLVAVFYGVYSTVRNTNEGDTGKAFRNARDLIDVQRFFGIYHEETLQDWAQHFKPVIIASNYFYGSLHFVVTGGVMLYLFTRWSDDYPLWRNTLAITTGLALIGFMFYPLMPRACSLPTTGSSTPWRSTPRSGRSTPGR